MADVVDQRAPQSPAIPSVQGDKTVAEIIKDKASSLVPNIGGILKVTATERIVDTDPKNPLPPIPGTLTEANITVQNGGGVTTTQTSAYGGEAVLTVKQPESNNASTTAPFTFPLTHEVTSSPFQPVAQSVTLERNANSSPGINISANFSENNPVGSSTETGQGSKLDALVAMQKEWVPENEKERAALQHINAAVLLLQAPIVPSNESTMFSAAPKENIIEGIQKAAVTTPQEVQTPPIAPTPPVASLSEAPIMANTLPVAAAPLAEPVVATAPQTPVSPSEPAYLHTTGLLQEAPPAAEVSQTQQVTASEQPVAQPQEVSQPTVSPQAPTPDVQSSPIAPLPLESQTPPQSLPKDAPAEEDLTKDPRYIEMHVEGGRVHGILDYQKNGNRLVFTNDPTQENPQQVNTQLNLADTGLEVVRGALGQQAVINEAVLLNTLRMGLKLWIGGTLDTDPQYHPLSVIFHKINATGGVDKGDPKEFQNALEGVGIVPKSL